MASDGEAVWFWSKSPTAAELSNFAPIPVTFDGVRWPTAEHAYQAAKFDDAAVRARIAEDPDPRRAKKVADAHAPLVRPGWAELRVEVTRRILAAKFAGDARAAAALAATGVSSLVHRSTSDLFWGRSPYDEQGENMLGRLLEDVRTALAD